MPRGRSAHPRSFGPAPVPRAVVAVLFGVAALLPSGARAQAPTSGGGPSATPPGIWWGVGVGLGALRFTCDICASDRDRGPSVYALVGAHASPALRVALEGGGWSRDDDGVRESVYRVGLTGFLNPDPDRGFHLLAGVGWVGYRADETRYDSGSLSVGMGWDVPVFSGWRMGNAARIEAASFGSFRNEDDRVASGVGLSMIHFDVTLTRR